MIMNFKIALPLLAVVITVASARMIGGLDDADPSEAAVKDALEFAVVEHNKRTNDVYVRQVAKVIKAQRQVVAGIKYVFTVEMARTSCRKGGAEQLCSIPEDPEMALPFQCTFEVWSRPWLSSIMMVKNSCSE